MQTALFKKYLIKRARKSYLVYKESQMITEPEWTSDYTAAAQFDHKEALDLVKRMIGYTPLPLDLELSTASLELEEIWVAGMVAPPEAF